MKVHRIWHQNDQEILIHRFINQSVELRNENERSQNRSLHRSVLYYDSELHDTIT